jgi:hypothetical protein
MQKKIFLGISLLLIFSVSTMIKPSSAVDTLTPDDFKLQSFSKTVDFFNFVRNWAASAGKPVPPADWHAYLYQTYNNVSGFQLYYSGLSNITAGEGALTIPVQSFIEHYKTPKGKDVLTSSSFIMLLAFNDTTTSKYPDSPDIRDNLYASFTLGLANFTDIFGNADKPALNSKTEIIPLTASADKLEWNWGMRYTNLTAIWWPMIPDPLNPRFTILPIAITTYDELEFRYKLIINTTEHTAKVEASYVIGRMTNLWLIEWHLFRRPDVWHYNSTGKYWLNGTQNSNETIYQFLQDQHIKMSIVLFQNSLVLDYTTESTFDNQNVTDAEVDVSDGAIATEAGNEKIFEANFGTKIQYKLYNYTADHTEQTYNPYNTTTRTAPRPGYARNPLFSMHVALLKYVPLIVAHIDPLLYQKAKDHMLNMTDADYFYLISYPKYSGFKVVHDPTYTAYIATTSIATEPPKLFGLILIGGIIAAVVIGAVIVLRRRGSKTQPVQPVQPSTPTTPTT